MAALTTLSSALSLVFKTIPRSSVVETVGRVWMLGGLVEGRVLVTKWEELSIWNDEKLRFP